jgi:hypothetical protein
MSVCAYKSSQLASYRPETWENCDESVRDSASCQMGMVFSPPNSQVKVFHVLASLFVSNVSSLQNWKLPTCHAIAKIFISQICHHKIEYPIHSIFWGKFLPLYPTVDCSRLIRHWKTIITPAFLTSIHWKGRQRSASSESSDRNKLEESRRNIR